jgi:sarcosine oxidase subunit alpha
MWKRVRPLADPVTVFLDGSPIEAERGEPLAVALLAADRATLARSPKLHRPRGPSCLRGGCDGCLARVDGVPDVMTCQRPARGEERIEAQNVVGSRRADLLRVTDWFFPHGIDHHHLMAGVPGVQDLMVGFARKLAGLGRVPADVAPAREARRLDAEVLVVGGGPAGLAAEGRDVVVVDDGLELGGSLLALGERGRKLIGRHPLGAARVLAGAVVAGIYRGEALVVTEEGARVVRPRATIVASGAHDGVITAPNDDLPGVLSARAVCRLAAHGVVPDGPVAIVGDGPWADEVEAALDEGASVRVAPRDLAAIKGTLHVKAVVVRTATGERTIPVAVVAIAAAGAPAFEIAAQAGARARLEPASGYVVERDDRGLAAPGVWAAGECAGLAFDPEALLRDGARVAEDVLSALAPPAATTR